MRSPGVIYRRYRQLKRRIIFEKIAEARRCKHSNCWFGVAVPRYEEDGAGPVRFVETLRMCSFPCHRAVKEAKDNKNLSAKDVLSEFTLCTFPEDCNAFINKRAMESGAAKEYLDYIKAAVVKEFEEELKDPEKKSKLYPELCAYEWVLDKNLYDASKSPSWVARLVVRIIEILENFLKIQKVKND